MLAASVGERSEVSFSKTFKRWARHHPRPIAVGRRSGSLDRGANRQGSMLHAAAAAFGFDPAPVRIEPPGADGALFRFSGPTQRPRTLGPHEHAAC